jgi:hypothetical protein
MTFVAKHFSNAGPTTLAQEIDPLQTSVPINEPSQPWPDPPFTVTIGRGEPNQPQEVCLVTAHASGVLTTVRDYDGNGAFTHPADATVEISATAKDWQDLNTHMIDRSRDDHPSLMKADGTRHDDPARHHLGVSLPTGPPTTSHVGDLYDPGAAPYLARANHIHGRADSWSTYTDVMLIPGLVVPVTAAGVTDSRFLDCDGSYYPKSVYPGLYSIIGDHFPPSNPSQQSFDPALHFAVPLLGQWVEGQMTWSYLSTRWAILADSP